MKHAFKLAALLLLGAAAAGCGIGDGSTIETFEIEPASSATQLKPFEQGDTYKLFECLRDELVVIATFTDGTRSNFSGRATWSSSNPAVVEVSNDDIPAVLLSANPAADGSFYESETLKYVKGTVVPKGAPGETAVITAKFAGLSASVNVEIRKPTLRIVAVPEDNPAAAAPPYYLGEGTTQRLTVLANADGRSVKAGEIAGAGANGFNINPFRWMFTGGTFVPQDDAVPDDFDRWVIDGGAGTIATLHAQLTDGLVTGFQADFVPHQVRAESSLCAIADTTLRPEADVQVATFYDDPGVPGDDRLVLSREANFRGGGFAAGDVVVATAEQMQLRAKLDANGDGSTIVEQHFNTQGRYLVQPFNSSCEVLDDLLGCNANRAFSASGGLVTAIASAAEGSVARVQACTPVCLVPQASLAADDTTVATGVDVNFTATAVNAPAGVTVNYLFDFGDGTTLGPQASALASHAYASADSYTATVRLVDAAFPGDFLSQNAGAVRILAGVAEAPGNTAPTATLTVSETSGEAPFAATLTATGTDSNSGDSITVYEFDPGDGTPVIRQSRPSLVHIYADGTGGPFTPAVRVYDESGVVSATATGSAITVNGTVTTFLRSNALDLRARKATLCSADVLPPLAAAATESAFSFPGVRFDVMGSFVADTDADTCSDPVIGTQLITRYMGWFVRPEGVDDETSEVAGVRARQDDFQAHGQVVYLGDVPAATTLDVHAVPAAPFSSDIEPTPSQLTVTPCVGCTP